MKKLIIALVVLTALAIPTTSNAAGEGQWLTHPSCTATATTLTCTGSAAIPRPLPIEGLGPPVAAIIAQFRYYCPPDPDLGLQGFDLFFPPLGDLQLQWVAQTSFHNGRAFSVQFSPPPTPWTISALFSCTVAWELNDPNSYNVEVDVGWGFGSATPITALAAPIGTVSP